MRRFTRLTAAHSKKFANHCHMVSLYGFLQFRSDQFDRSDGPGDGGWYSDRLWEMDDMVRLVEAYENSAKVKL